MGDFEDPFFAPDWKTKPSQPDLQGVSLSFKRPELELRWKGVDMSPLVLNELWVWCSSQHLHSDLSAFPSDSFQGSTQALFTHSYTHSGGYVRDNGHWRVPLYGINGQGGCKGLHDAKRRVVSVAKFINFVSRGSLKSPQRKHLIQFEKKESCSVCRSTFFVQG